jgi:hypothetical protein
VNLTVQDQDWQRARVSNHTASTAEGSVEPSGALTAGAPEGQPPVDGGPEDTSLEAVGPESSPREAAAPAWRPPDLEAIEQALQLLARAVRQFHTYPATSPLCADAIAVCHKALVSLGGDQVRVTTAALLVDEVGVGRRTIIERSWSPPPPRRRCSADRRPCRVSPGPVAVWRSDLGQSVRKPLEERQPALSTRSYAWRTGPK